MLRRAFIAAALAVGLTGDRPARDLPLTAQAVTVTGPDAADPTFNIKDPSVVPLPDGSYEMYATIFSRTMPGKIGRFHGMQAGGPYAEEPPAQLVNVDGPEAVAPAVLFARAAGGPLWTMFVQTSCFQENGVIARATSHDGVTFQGDDRPAVTKTRVPGTVGLYDVAVSVISWRGAAYEAMVFSGYRTVGSGDLYIALRPQGPPGSDGAWSDPRLILRQEDVPFHNRPGAPGFEWGLEGAKIEQLGENSFMLVGVCFLDHGMRGTRQRVFRAVSSTPDGRYAALDTPFAPVAGGENGHPDTIDRGDRLGILYQERDGEGKPWHLRYAEPTRARLLRDATAGLAP